MDSNHWWESLYQDVNDLSPCDISISRAITSTDTRKWRGGTRWHHKTIMSIYSLITILQIFWQGYFPASGNHRTVIISKIPGQSNIIILSHITLFAEKKVDTMGGLRLPYYGKKAFTWRVGTSWKISICIRTEIKIFLAIAEMAAPRRKTVNMESNRRSRLSQYKEFHKNRFFLCLYLRWGS